MNDSISADLDVKRRNNIIDELFNYKLVNVLYRKIQIRYLSRFLYFRNMLMFCKFS